MTVALPAPTALTRAIKKRNTASDRAWLARHATLTGLVPEHVDSFFHILYTARGLTTQDYAKHLLRVIKKYNKGKTECLLKEPSLGELDAAVQETLSRGARQEDWGTTNVAMKIGLALDLIATLKEHKLYASPDGVDPHYEPFAVAEQLFPVPPYLPPVPRAVVKRADPKAAGRALAEALAKASRPARGGGGGGSKATHSPS